MKILYSYLRKSRGVIFVAVAAGVLGGGASTGLITLLHRATSSQEYSARQLLPAFICLGVLVPLSKFVSGDLLIRLSQKYLFELRMQLSEKILVAPLRQLEEVGLARLLATLTGDTLAISEALSLFPHICINLSVIAVCLVYLGWLSWTVLLIVLCTLGLRLWSFRLLSKRSNRHLKTAREDQDQLVNHFLALVDGNKELKLHRERRLAFVAEELKPVSEIVRKRNVVGMNIYNGAINWGQMLVFAMLGLLALGFPAWGYMSPQGVVGCIFVVLFMLGPLESVMHQFPTLGQASVALQKIEALGLSLAAGNPECDSRPHTSHAVHWSSLKLDSVTHKYKQESEEHMFTLGPLDLTIYPRELVFLVGGNGSGKTTMAKLITGLYHPEGGEIRLNDEPITNDNRDYYRQHFSAVFSDFFLFARFIGLYKPELDRQARKYLSCLQLNHKVSINDATISTLNLSRGQRKRLALLIAYLEDRPIYMFDEWAAEQDPVFKEVFYNELLPELKARGKTVIVISHDDKYYGVADRIVKLEDGRIVGEENRGQEQDCYSLSNA
jgi:putative ATP-binding cassette transporter